MGRATETLSPEGCETGEALALAMAMDGRVWYNSRHESQ